MARLVVTLTRGTEQLALVGNRVDDHDSLRHAVRVNAGSTPNNLPAQLTSFVGREDDVVAIVRALEESRLVTLTGTGGCGKTRLAVNIAGRVAARHPDGVWMADLSAVRSGEFVTPVIAAAAHVTENPHRPVIESLVDALRDRKVLIVLDNCEHLVSNSASTAMALLEGCPGVTLLATSRHPLEVPGEMTWPVPPLGLPREDSLEVVARAPAVQLFVERARACRPSFRLSDETAPSVAAIVRSLDGLPLAIELAAARSRAFTPDQIVGLLADRFALLKGGHHTTVARQRTLEASVEWSYDLLDGRERELLQRLSVFAGTFSLRAAGHVAGDGAGPPVDELSSLVDGSLIEADGDGYRLLETIRDFAKRRLIETGADATIKGRHLDYYVAFAEENEHELSGAGMFDAVERLEIELDNIRAALSWAGEAGRNVDRIRLAAALALFWTRHSREGLNWLSVSPATSTLPVAVKGKAALTAAELALYVGDAARMVEWANEALNLGIGAGDEQMVARAKNVLAYRGFIRGDPGALELLGETLPVHRRYGVPYDLVYTLGMMACMHAFRGEPDAARQTGTEAVDIARRSGNPLLLCRALVYAGLGIFARGAFAEALATFRESSDIGALLGDEYGPALANGHLLRLRAIVGAWHEAAEAADELTLKARRARIPVGYVTAIWSGASVAFERWTPGTPGGEVAKRLEDAQSVLVTMGMPAYAAEVAATRANLASFEGDIGLARSLAAEGMTLSASPYGGAGAGWCHWAVAFAALRSGESSAAAASGYEAVDSFVHSESRLGLVFALELLGHVLAAAGMHADGVRLLAAAAADRQHRGCPLPPVFCGWLDGTLASARSVLEPGGFDRAWAEGEALSLAEALAFARRGRGRRNRATTGWPSLTPTELEVVRLAAEGLRNADIAARMFVSPGTVKTHLSHIFAKLGVSNRSELTALAIQRAL
ncbi:MAG: LuxR C-terminal-related transcriptional regulator [Actinomycetota bacterium]